MSASGFKSFPDYISFVSDEEYATLDSYFQFLDSIVKITNHCLFLIDFYKGELLYVSNNPLILRGWTPDEVKKLKSNFIYEYASKEEGDLYTEVIRSWFNFLENKPVSERLHYSLRYNYQINNLIIDATMVPVFLSDEGKPWLIICNSKTATHARLQKATILKKNSTTSWSYIFGEQKWKEERIFKLNETEIKVLRLSTQGKKEKEISDEIYRSVDGLKSIKRKIFKKMGVNNITEAVCFAMSYDLI